MTTTSSPPLTLALLHRRMAHIGSHRLKKLVKLEMANGIIPKDLAKLDTALPKICEPCLAGKQHRKPFPHSTSSTSHPLELIVSDIHGPMPPTDEGYKYWLLFIDVHTRYAFAYLLRKKSEAFECFKDLKILVEKQTGFQIKRLRDDKGGEFIGKKWNAFLTEQGIIHERTTVNTPQQNGIAERKNRTLEEAVTSMLAQAKLPRAVWGQAIQLAIRITNASPSSAIKDKTPYEAFHGKKPDLSLLRVFGCRAYVHVQKEKRKDAKWHTQRCIYLGFEDGYKGFKCYNPETNQFVISRDVVFDEDDFPGIPWTDEDEAFVPISGGYYPVPDAPAPAPGPLPPAPPPPAPPAPPAPSPPSSTPTTPSPSPPASRPLNDDDDDYIPPGDSESSASSSPSLSRQGPLFRTARETPDSDDEHTQSEGQKEMIESDEEIAPPEDRESSEDGQPIGFRLPSEERGPKSPRRGIGYKKGKGRAPSTPIKEEPNSPPTHNGTSFRYNESPARSPIKSKKVKGQRELQALMRDSFSADPEPAGPSRRPVRLRQPPKKWWIVGGEAQPLRLDAPSDNEDSSNHEDDSP
ncbi:hypothetical protein FRC01_006358, partial [Tulasnella sp. 417]